MYSPTESITVLHVDDDVAFADLAATHLEREDARLDVETATSATEGMARLDEGGVDCVVSDYEMPGRNGIEFLHAVREERPDLPFILYTGRGSERVASDAISAGVTDYLQKDAGTSQYTVLANRIGNAVAAHRSRAAVAATERRLSLLAAESEDVLFIFDADWDACLFVNDAYEDVWGAPTAELDGDPTAFLDYVHPDDRAAVRESMGRLADGETVEEEYRVCRPDGERRWVRTRSKPVRGDDGAVDRIVGYARDVTERVERERRYEAIFDNTHTFVGLLDPDGTVVEANETALSFGGLSRDAVVGTPIWKTGWFQTGPAARASARAAVRRARRGDLFRDEVRVRGADGTAVIDFTVRPITDAEGEVRLLLPEGRDVTERRAQARKRREVIDRVTDAIVEVDAEWRFTLVNGRAEQLYGTAEADLLGRSLWDVFDDARGTRFESTYREVMRTRRPDSVVAYYDGLDAWFEVQVYPNDDGGLAFYFRDVTERQRRQRDLEVAEARYRALAEHYPDGGVFYFDDDRRYQVVTGGGFDHVGADPADVEGRRPGEVEAFSAETADRLDATMRATLDGATETLELAHEDRVYEVRSAPIRDDEDTVVAGLFVARDVTERRRRERALERRNERLDAFASVVSHDLTNPLSVARGKVALARAESDHEQPALDDAVDALDRGLDIVDDLLALARADGDDPEPVALGDLVRACWTAVDAPGARLEADVDGAVVARSGQLRRLLTNLFRNAVEHGGDSVTVTVTGLSDGFAVADDGAGLSAAARENAFEAGYSTEADGTGYGLYVVEQVVEAHGWTVSVGESADGGARFEFGGVERPD